jgi:hypothetical protein
MDVRATSNNSYESIPSETINPILEIVNPAVDKVGDEIGIGLLDIYVGLNDINIKDNVRYKIKHYKLIK